MFHIDEGSGKNDPESVSWTGSSPNVNQFFRLAETQTTCENVASVDSQLYCAGRPSFVILLG